MKIIQTLTFFGYTGLHVVEDEIDTAEKRLVYLKKAVETEEVTHHELVEKIENDLIYLEDIDTPVNRSEVIRVLDRFDIPKKMQHLIKEGSVIETSDAESLGGSAKYLEVGSKCTVKNHHSIVVKVKEAIKPEEDADDWDDEFVCEVIFVNFLEKKGTKIGDVMTIKRRNLAELSYSQVYMLCPCCDHVIY